jgi:hypothetical protein
VSGVHGETRSISPPDPRSVCTKRLQLSWSTIGGYLVNLDKQILEGAPTYGMDEDFRWTSD